MKKKKIYGIKAVVGLLMFLLLAGCGQTETATTEKYLDVTDAEGSAEDDFDKYLTQETGGQTDASGDGQSQKTEVEEETAAAAERVGTPSAADEVAAPNEPTTSSEPLVDEASDLSAPNTPSAVSEPTNEPAAASEPNPPESPKATDTTSSTDTDSGQEANTCTLLVECATLRANMDKLSAAKQELVPEDGILYAKTILSFAEGDTAFDILQREMQNNRIQMEYTYTPAYDSNYIEGIGNLYEFDGGELSGWMYCVNGVYLNYGCSQYKVQDGDSIEFHYTCDLGRDLGQGL